MKNKNSINENKTKENKISIRERIQYLLDTYERQNNVISAEESFFDELGLDFTPNNHFLDVMPPHHLCA